MFSRLEAREILRNLDRQNCDEEVVAKLESLAQTRGQQSAQADGYGASIVVPTNVQVTSSLNMPRQDYRHLTDEEFEALKAARLAEKEHDAKKALAIPESLLNPPIGVRSNIDRIPPGSRNSVGDVCLSINADGFSVFQCHEGHGYIQNNPVVRGCTTCAVQGNNSANRSTGEARSDSGAIVGMDSNW